MEKTISLLIFETLIETVMCENIQWCIPDVITDVAVVVVDDDV